jgi:hypothetical protein
MMSWSHTDGSFVAVVRALNTRNEVATSEHGLTVGSTCRIACVCCGHARATSSTEQATSILLWRGTGTAI